ncbi:MAG: hypothetical protein ACYDAE_15930 [Steroidobacteraceae bacterium]
MPGDDGASSSWAILFWCYKDAALCLERLQLLEALNPTVPVYALYGGDPAGAPAFREVIRDHVEDFWCYPEAKEPEWKWHCGDELIRTWYQQAGRKLPFRHLFICQWDMLVMERIERLFRGIREDQLALSGARPIEDVATWWYWVSPRNRDHYSRYQRFRSHLRARYGSDAAWCCLFVVACFPRRFLDEWSAAHVPEMGFLEYTLPSYAKHLGFDFYSDAHFSPWWKGNPATTHIGPEGKSLNAGGFPVPWEVIEGHLGRGDGDRMFHPVRSHIPQDVIRRWLERKQPLTW